MAFPPPPYVDAVCGRPLCGEARTGSWWAYPTPSELDLRGVPPLLYFLGQVPPAALSLGGVLPVVVLFVPPQPAPAGLVLGTELPTFRISSTLLVTPAELVLSGEPPEYIGRLWLLPEPPCVDDDLAALVCSDQDLALAVESEEDLIPLVCR